MNAETNEQLRRLLHATAGGDRAAFNLLYKQTSPHLYAIAIRLVHRRSAAEDVLQDAYVQVWHRAGDYHVQRGTVIGWMTALVRYRAIDMLRRRRNSRPFDEESMGEPRAGPDAGDSGDAALTSAAASEDADFLHECVSRLSGSQRESVALAFFHGLTHQELSRHLALPLGTIKSRLRRSLKRLRACLEDLGYKNELRT